MKAMIWKGQRRFTLEQRPRPRAGKGEAVVRVAYVGICGTDMGIYAEKKEHGSRFSPPRVLGHEISGTVVALGAETGDFALDQKVVINPVVNCEKCYFCLTGRPQLCEDSSALRGADLDGGLQEYILVPTTKIIAVPDNISLDEACLTEPLTCVLQAASFVDINPGDYIIVLGCGLGGLYFVQLAKIMRAGLVIFTGTRKERLRMGEKMGADITINAKEKDVVDIVMDKTGGKGAEIVFEAAGVPQTIQQSIQVVRRGGHIVIYGAPVECVNSMDFRQFNIKGLSMYGGVGPGPNPLFERAIKLISSGKIQAKEAITHEFRLTDTPKAFELVEKRREGVIRALIRLS